MGIFTLSHGDLAKALIGRALHVGSREVVILDAAGFPRATNDRGIYRPVLTMPPGEIHCPKQHNSVLLLIVCRDGNGSGGCVLIKKIETSQGAIEGPGRVTSVLGIPCQSLGQVVERPDGVLELRTATVPVRPVTSRARLPGAGRGIGEATLRRLMNKIVSRFLASKRSKTFKEFVEELLAGCRTEADLLARLGAAETAGA